MTASGNQTALDLATHIAAILGNQSGLHIQDYGVFVDEKKYNNHYVSFDFGAPSQYPFTIIKENEFQSRHSCCVDYSYAPSRYEESEFVTTKDMVALIAELSNQKMAEKLVTVFNFLDSDRFIPLAPTLSRQKDELFISFVRNSCSVKFIIPANFK